MKKISSFILFIFCLVFKGNNISKFYLLFYRVILMRLHRMLIHFVIGVSLLIVLTLKFANMQNILIPTDFYIVILRDYEDK